jgi:hypothetical protein
MMRATLLAVLVACGPAAPGADTAWLRVQAAGAGQVTAVDAATGYLAWTSSIPGPYTIERTTAPGAAWLPLAYGSNAPAAAETVVPDHRPFRLGFTPFPYAIGTDAPSWLAIMSNVYGFIATNADTVCHHFDSGVPWPEALAGDPFPAAMQDDLAFRKNATPPGHTVVLAITPIDLARRTLAPYRGTAESMPLPPPWNGYGFDQPEVQEAFANYAQRMIDWFQPGEVILGIEVNLLLINEPERWPAYLALHTGVYARIKEQFTNLPVSVSLTGMDLIEGVTGANHTGQLAAVEALTPHVDFYALSFHPILSALLADTVPGTGMMTTLFDRMAKPVAIAETSYPAQPFTINNGQFTFQGSPEKQNEFFRNLFTALHGRPARYVINFVAIDYDALWTTQGEPDDLNKLWRDTGLNDESLTARPALHTWQGQLALPFTPSP